MRTENPNDCRINSAGAEKRICPGGVLCGEVKKSNWKGEAILRVARPYI